MNDDLIRRSDALETIQGIGITAIAAYARINAIPAVDAVEVSWIERRIAKKRDVRDRLNPHFDQWDKYNTEIVVLEHMLAEWKRREEAHNGE